MPQLSVDEAVVYPSVMDFLLAMINRVLDVSTACALRAALAIQDFKRWLNHHAYQWRGSLRRLWREFLYAHGLAEPPPFVRRGHVPWNRTPEHVEADLVRLHVEQPQLGIGPLRLLARRVLGFSAARETIRQILIRRRDLIVEAEQARRRRPRRIQVSARGHLWGVDFTLVWVLGFLPAWVFGAVDYHGSRLLAFERTLADRERRHSRSWQGDRGIRRA